MPVHRGQDKEGPFMRWGKKGKKYYYTSGDEESRNRAKEKARKQGIAIGYKEG